MNQPITAELAYPITAKQAYPITAKQAQSIETIQCLIVREEMTQPITVCEARREMTFKTLITTLMKNYCRDVQIVGAT